MALKLLHLMDPDSPGMKVWVMRGWWGNRFYPKHFATTRESLRFRELTTVMDSYDTTEKALKRDFGRRRNPTGVVIT
jgi:hypothetical protein